MNLYSGSIHRLFATMATIRKREGGGRLIGYARVSTEEQGTDAQIDELRAAGCQSIHEEHASGADWGRPVLGVEA